MGKTRCVLIAGLLAGLTVTAISNAADRPNVIVIMTDDQGTADLGAAGATDVETPHLDGITRRRRSIQSVLRRGAGLLALARGAAHGPPPLTRPVCPRTHRRTQAQPACRLAKSRLPRCSDRPVTPRHTSASGTWALAPKRCRWDRASASPSAIWAVASIIIHITSFGRAQTGTTSFVTAARSSAPAGSSAI